MGTYVAFSAFSNFLTELRMELVVLWFYNSSNADEVGEYVLQAGKIMIVDNFLAAGRCPLTYITKR